MLFVFHTEEAVVNLSKHAPNSDAASQMSFSCRTTTHKEFHTLTFAFFVLCRKPPCAVLREPNMKMMDTNSWINKSEAGADDSDSEEGCGARAGLGCAVR